jgi:flagellar motor protein MotB
MVAFQYIETHEPDRYAGHLRLRLVEFAPSRLVFDIDRAINRRVEVTFTLDPQRF